MAEFGGVCHRFPPLLFPDVDVAWKGIDHRPCFFPCQSPIIDSMIFQMDDVIRLLGKFSDVLYSEGDQFKISLIVEAVSHLKHSPFFINQESILSRMTAISKDHRAEYFVDPGNLDFQIPGQAFPHDPT